MWSQEETQEGALQLRHFTDEKVKSTGAHKAGHTPASQSMQGSFPHVSLLSWSQSLGETMD